MMLHLATKNHAQRNGLTLTNVGPHWLAKGGELRVTAGSSSLCSDHLSSFRGEGISRTLIPYSQCSCDVAAELLHLRLWRRVWLKLRRSLRPDAKANAQSTSE